MAGYTDKGCTCALRPLSLISAIACSLASVCWCCLCDHELNQMEELTYLFFVGERDAEKLLFLLG